MSWVALGAAGVSAAGAIGGSLLGKQSAPATAAYQNVDPTQVQQNAIQGDLSTLGSANQLANASNSTDLMQAISNLNTALPGFSGLQSSITGTAQQDASNPYAVPQSAISQILQTGAENNIMGGTGAASAFSGNNALRSLGVNILQYGQQNFQNSLSALSTLTGTAPNVSPVSPLTFMLTPQNALSAVTNNNTQNQAVQQGANNAAAAASNANSSNLFDSLSSSGLFGQNGILQSLISPTGTNAANSGALNFASPSISNTVGPLTATGT